MNWIFRLFKFFFTILVFFSLSSCLSSPGKTGAFSENEKTVSSSKKLTDSSKEQNGKLHPVYVTNSKKISLLSPSSMEGEKTCLQSLEGSFGQKTFSLLCYLQLDSKGIFVSLMNEFGSGMGELSFDGSSVSFSSSVFPKKLKAEYIVSDFQFAYYKSRDLEETFSKAGLKFVENQEEICGIEGVAEVRRIFEDQKCEKCIEKIVKQGKVIIIENYLRNYSYVLTEEE